MAMTLRLASFLCNGRQALCTHNFVCCCTRRQSFWQSKFVCAASPLFPPLIRRLLLSANCSAKFQQNESLVQRARNIINVSTTI